MYSQWSRYFIVTLLVLWCALHSVGVLYGTHQVPLHMSYVGDEQSPVNGALHMLEDKNPLGLRNIKTLYYGPVFALIATPAVVGDFALKYLTGEARSAEAYRTGILWDWGGINRGVRIVSVFAGALALVYVYRLLLLPTFNPRRVTAYALVGTSLIALNFYFFEYSHFFKHWVFLALVVCGQLFHAVRLRESNGTTARDWWMHGILTVIGFGISYFSALYIAAFLPLAYRLYRAGTFQRRYLVRYALGVGIACVLVVAWHPYALVRYLGFTGVGSMSGTVHEQQNPFALDTGSLEYYGNLLVLNHAPLILAALLLTYVLYRRGVRGQGWWLYMLGAVAFLTAFLFVPAPHHEGRYMLLIILMCTLGVATALLKYFEAPSVRTRATTVVLIAFVGAYFAYHTVHIARWISIYREGPVEQRMIDEVLALQQEDDRPVALVQSYIAGHVHTKEAYRAYIEKRGRQDTNLYNAILAAPLPNDVQPLNVRYIWPSEYTADTSVIDTFGYAFLYVNPRPSELNQFDYMDENLVRLWYFDSLMPTYVRLK